MANGIWISLLTRQSPDGAPIGWDDLVVGHDFGLLGPDEIQDWARERPDPGPACQALAALEGPALLRFEEALWAACTEAGGKVPRPGGRRWARAQDRWRVALLRDAMASPLSAEALAVAVENIYEKVGCPEDMLGLWQHHSPWQGRQGGADRDAITRFLRRREDDLVNGPRG
jgi:hypothetical protein